MIQSVIYETKVLVTSSIRETMIHNEMFSVEHFVNSKF